MYIYFYNWLSLSIASPTHPVRFEIEMRRWTNVPGLDYHE